MQADAASRRGLIQALKPMKEKLSVTQKYEYKFVRLGEGMTSVKKAGRDGYQEAVHKHAAKGWRLVQVFAPGTGAYGAAKYYELVLERPIS